MTSGFFLEPNYGVYPEITYLCRESLHQNNVRNFTWFSSESELDEHIVRSLSESEFHENRMSESPT